MALKSKKAEPGAEQGAALAGIEERIVDDELRIRLKRMTLQLSELAEVYAGRATDCLLRDQNQVAAHHLGRRAGIEEVRKLLHLLLVQ